MRGLEDPGAGLAAAPGHPPVDHDGRIAPPPVVAASRGSGTTHAQLAAAGQELDAPADRRGPVGHVLQGAGRQLDDRRVLGRLDGRPVGRRGGPGSSA